MPPNLDVYVISPARSRETIDRFLDAYVDRNASDDRGNEELMFLALDLSGQPSTGDDWDWEPSRSLGHIVERGLDFPRRAFSVYLKPLDQVIFGLSMDDEGGKPENLERAKKLLHEMAERLAATHGFIGVEQEPPLRGKKEPPPTILVYSWQVPG